MHYRNWIRDGEGREREREREKRAGREWHIKAAAEWGPGLLAGGTYISVCASQSRVKSMGPLATAAQP